MKLTQANGLALCIGFDTRQCVPSLTEGITGIYLTLEKVV